MTPEEIETVVQRMPISPAQRQQLLSAAVQGKRVPLLIVRLHAWRQRQMDRPAHNLIGQLWRRLWR